MIGRVRREYGWGEDGGFVWNSEGTFAVRLRGITTLNLTSTLTEMGSFGESSGLLQQYLTAMPERPRDDG